MRRTAFALAGTALVTLVALGLGEAVIRFGAFTPRAQIVRADDPEVGHSLRLLRGHPVWEAPGSAERQRLDCTTEETYDVLILGSSILHGVQLPPEDTADALMQRRLDDGDERVCVHNHAQPAFVSGNKWAVAQEVVPTLQPELVLWEVWHDDPGRYTLVDGDAYNVTAMPTTAAGVPHTLPLPAALNDTLFVRSALYRYATLALTAYDPDREDAAWAALVEETLPDLKALVEAHGGELRLVFAPPLDVPFDETLERHADPQHPYQTVIAWAQDAGVDTFDLAAGLLGLEPSAIRLDPCCRYNDRGHEAVGQVLTLWTRQAMETR